MPVIKTLLYFFLAGLLEISGGYLIWLWVREGKPITFGIIGALLLTLYGVVPTLQSANFGRIYAAYGGAFVLLSLLWGWGIDKIPPDRFDWLGAWIIFLGVLVMIFAPRTY